MELCIEAVKVSPALQHLVCFLRLVRIMISGTQGRAACDIHVSIQASMLNQMHHTIYHRYSQTPLIGCHRKGLYWLREWSTSAFCWQYQYTSSLSSWIKQTVRNNEVSESSGCPQSRVWLKISSWKELTWHLPDGYNRKSEEYYSSLVPATAGLLLSLKKHKTHWSPVSLSG